MIQNRQAEGGGAADAATGEAIVAYLRAHPEAQDTARGIAQWWLPEMGLARGVSDTERVLNRLVDEGRVLVRTAADGQRHYRLGGIEGGRKGDEIKRRDPGGRRAG